MHQSIRDEVKKAMLAKDEVRVLTLKGLMAAFTNELVAKKRKPSEELSDDEAMAVLKRAVKQRKDSIEQFRAGGRDDLAKSEEAELAILEPMLPATVGKDKILEVATKKKEELGANDKSKLGVLMGAVMKELKGQADGADVKEVVEGLFK